MYYLVDIEDDALVIARDGRLVCSPLKGEIEHWARRIEQIGKGAYKLGTVELFGSAPYRRNRVMYRRLSHSPFTPH